MKINWQGHSNQNKVASAEPIRNGDIDEQAKRNANHSSNQIYPKPSSTAAELFRGRHKLVQCYHSYGWGHVLKTVLHLLTSSQGRGVMTLPPI